MSVAVRLVGRRQLGRRSPHAGLGRLTVSEAGAELVELALALPLLLLLLLGMADFGFMLQAYGVVNNAAREGARLAILESQGYTTAVVQSRVAAYISEALPAGSVAPTSTCVKVGGVLTGPGICVDNVSVPVTTVGELGTETLTVHTKQVTVVYPHTFRFIGGVAGLLGTSYATVNVRAVATMRTEAAAE